MKNVAITFQHHMDNVAYDHNTATTTSMALTMTTQKECIRFGRLEDKLKDYLVLAY